MGDITMTRRSFLGAAAMAAALAGCRGTADGTGDGGKGPVTDADGNGGDIMGNGTAPAEDGAQGAIPLVVTEQEPVDGDAAWCGSMQVCWDMLMDRFNGGRPIVFDDEASNTAEIAHLNERTFGTQNMSDDHYYAYAGFATLAARDEIEEALMAKFGEGSDILSSISWAESQLAADRLLYAMIFRRFAFEHPFELNEGDGLFGYGGADDGRQAYDVTYFEAADDDQRSQVSVLYYASPTDHATRIATADGDEVILVRSPAAGTLGEIWAEANRRSEGYDGGRSLAGDETFMCPCIDIDLRREFPEWGRSTFSVSLDGWIDKARITEAIQTLKLSLDNEGGRVKSEAAITLKIESAMPADRARDFSYDGRFAMFVVDANAPDPSMPYVGVLVDDVTRFQAGATRD